MKERDLIKKLNSLKKVSADSDFRNNNRSLLISQISNSGSLESSRNAWLVLFEQFSIKIFKGVSQPVIAVFMISVFLLGGSALSLRAAKNSKPGDSLYAAKIASEKTQLALTFSEKKKIKLGMEFAGNRAREIDQVMAVEEDEEKVERVEKLVNNFKKEIEEVKSRVVKININENKESEGVENVSSGNAENIEDVIGEEEPVFSANLDRDKKGIQIADKKESVQKEAEINGIEIVDNKDAKVSVVPTTTEMGAGNTASTTNENTEQIDNNAGDAQKILSQAEQLLNKEDYDGIISKLNEAGDAINNIDQGKVRGAEEIINNDNEGQSTSTQPSVEGETL